MAVGFLGEDREGQRMYPKRQKEEKNTHTVQSQSSLNS